MDALTYHYNGNRLMQVTDAESIEEGFKDGNTSGDDYIYDANGNMITDRNKNIDTITYNHLNLPAIVTKTTGEHVNYIYNAAGVKMSQEVYDAANTLTKKTDYLGEFYYENDTLKFINHEEGRVVMTGLDPEYQYTLNDHLGNARITFTTTQKVESFLATMDTDDQQQEQNAFGAYNSYTNEALDPTPSGSANDKILILNGGYDGQVGLTKSLAVVPGDIIATEVYAKYLETTSAPSNLLNFAVALTDAFGLVPGLPDEGGTAYEALSSFGSLIASGGREADEGEPKGFLNIVAFDKDHNFVDVAFRQIKASDSPDDTISLRLNIRQAGYVYVFLSNESQTLQQIGFDNYGVTQHHSYVIQQDDYYPFGLTFNSYRRENSMLNSYQYNGKELHEELALGWNDYGARMYMADIGRWTAIDPLSGVSRRWSPYNYGLDNPIRFIDPDGMLNADYREEKDEEYDLKFSDEKFGKAEKEPEWHARQDPMRMIIASGEGEASPTDDFKLKDDGTFELMSPTDDEFHRYFSEDGELIYQTNWTREDAGNHVQTLREGVEPVSDYIEKLESLIRAFEGDKNAPEIQKMYDRASALCWDPKSINTMIANIPVVRNNDLNAMIWSFFPKSLSKGYTPLQAPNKIYEYFTGRPYSMPDWHNRKGYDSNDPRSQNLPAVKR